MVAEGGKAEGEALVGGMANVGEVFRRGGLVERQAARHAGALHDHLRALKERGFDAGPEPVRLTDDGREELSFIPGDVGLPPFPAWVMGEGALRSGLAAGLIDFDLAAPGRAIWDVAMAARYWVPMLDPTSAAERAELPGVIEQATAVCRAFVAGRVADGDPVFAEALAGQGGWGRWDRIQEWLVAQRPVFTAALVR